MNEYSDRRIHTSRSLRAINGRSDTDTRQSNARYDQNGRTVMAIGGLSLTLSSRALFNF